MASALKDVLHTFEQKSDGIYLDGLKIKGVKKVTTSTELKGIPTLTVEMLITFPLAEKEKPNEFMKELEPI